MKLCYPGAFSWSHSGNLAVNPAVANRQSQFRLFLQTSYLHSDPNWPERSVCPDPSLMCPLQLLISAGCENGEKSNPLLRVTNVYCCSGHLFVGFILDRGPQAYFLLSRWWVFRCSSGWIRFSLSEPWISDRVLWEQGYFLYEKEPPRQIRTMACSGTQILECQVLDQGWAFSCMRQTASPHRGREGWPLGYIYGPFSVSTMSVTEDAKAHIWACIFLPSAARPPRHTLPSPSGVEVIFWPLNDTFRFTV